MQVKDGAWLVGRMILGKCWLLQNASTARTNWEIVFWDNFWCNNNMDNPSSADSMINRGTISDMDELVTLSGFQYQESGTIVCYVDVLKSDVSNHLLANVVQYINNQVPKPQLHLVNHCRQHNIQDQSATPLCWQCGYVNLVALSVQQVGNLGAIGLKTNQYPPCKVTGTNTSTNSSSWQHN